VRAARETGSKAAASGGWCRSEEGGIWQKGGGAEMGLRGRKMEWISRGGGQGWGPVTLERWD